jgi:hypothetical protein
MKNFFSIEKFIGLTVLLILEFVLLATLMMLTSVDRFGINYWNWKAFIISICIWVLCSIVDKEKYFNLATLLGNGSFAYLLWWFVFNLQLH